MATIGTYKVHEVDLESLDALEESLELEARQHDHAVAAVRARVDGDDERVDVRHGQEAGLRLRLDAVFFSGCLLVPSDLHHVGDDVAMGDHDGFLTRFCSTLAESPGNRGGRWSVSD